MAGRGFPGATIGKAWKDWAGSWVDQSEDLTKCLARSLGNHQFCGSPESKVSTESPREREAGQGWNPGIQEKEWPEKREKDQKAGSWHYGVRFCHVSGTVLDARHGLSSH